MVRAVRVAPVTGGAFLGVDDRWLVSIIDEIQHTGRAEFDAQPAALAPHPENRHPARGLRADRTVPLPAAEVFRSRHQA